ncbi:hypothetical protein PFICI_01921 [Pestalotiopsis fici W106-1]|uniref:Uncharacterized protein n=1 Tax=Pestalotiopsis fici (strain W106-1 / CGMCC3.15140) TaxID=1229662 RepID=W3XPW0_PESFW|nr:uncharacterized protein PFICI_01921 [Pestalotiopsis fici W106-1]ETS88093.1 hypothetical protein PFICI_01921 [Pestalotiopsis fici W106-1]
MPDPLAIVLTALGITSVAFVVAFSVFLHIIVYPVLDFEEDIYPGLDYEADWSNDEESAISSLRSSLPSDSSSETSPLLSIAVQRVSGPQGYGSRSYRPYRPLP